MSWLLDVNFLLASRWTTHADHAAVREWLDEQLEFHTTPIVELGFMRVSLSPGYSASWQDAHRSLISLYSRPAHHFLADSSSPLWIWPSSQNLGRPVMRSTPFLGRHERS